MAVAVKDTPQAGARSPLDPVLVGSLLGAVYVLGSIGVVFYGLPRVWESVVPSGLAGSFLGGALRLVLMVAAAGGLGYLGVRLLGPQPPRGIRSGIFFAAVGIVGIAILTWMIGTILERWLPGADWRIPGIVLTLGIGLGVIALAFRSLTRPDTTKWLLDVEDQGWFSVASYKRTQGVRVRRATIIGILILAGCGVWTLHRSLSTAETRDWVVELPFSTVTVDKKGDTDLEVGVVLNRATFAAANDSLKGMVRITDPGESDYESGQLVKSSSLDDKRADLRTGGKKLPSARSVEPATGAMMKVPILPDIRFSLPILLAIAAGWLTWRVVNYPVFADFLIATEAEMNKVSWTTRKRLVQDTIVVLVTVVLLTVFLFLVDIAWGFILSNPWVGVLKKPDPAKQQKVVDEEQPW